jgi:branched-chain amino acid transport system ATP-binding protein
VAVILRLDNIGKSLSGVEILGGISLDISQGERHAIIGPNGAGKTTLFHVITGLYRPTSGSISFRGRDVTGLSPHKIARLGLSRSFQVTSVFPKMTVYENIRNAIVSKVGRRFTWSCRLDRCPEIRDETDSLVDLFRLGNVRDRAAMTLSYGWQRRLEVALTLATNPSLILLDEPTAGVDVKETRAFVEFIKEVTRGKTLLIIEHDMDVVYNLADRITVLNRGRILTTGTLDDIRHDERVQHAYAGRR